MAVTKNGNAVEYDGGKFHLQVTYQCTNSCIQATPAVVVTQNLDHGHDVTIWATTNDGHTETWKRDAKGADVKDKATFSFKQKNIFDDYVTFYAHLNSITGKQGGKTITIPVSKNSALAIQTTTDPHPPGPVHVEAVGGQGVDNKVSVYVEHIFSTGYKPVQYLQFYRRSESITSGATWEAVGIRQNFGNQGPVVGKDNQIHYPPDQSLHIYDNGVGAGNRYQYRCTVTSPNGKSASSQSEWKFTSPPPPTDVSHVRLDDSTNLVYFSRDKRAVVLGLITGFRFQYNTLDPLDPAFVNGWKTFTAYENFDKGRRQIGGLLTQDYDDVAFKHQGLSRDTRYSYRICTINNMHGRLPAGQGRLQPSAWVDYMGTATTYNTPSKPRNISGVADLSVDRKVTLKITPSVHRDNGTADVVYIQRRKGSGGKWVDLPRDSDDKKIPLSSKWSDSGLAYVDGAFEYEDADVLEFDAGTDLQYRAAFGCTKTNQNGDPVLNHGKSDWSDAFSVSMKAKPNPPNLILPVKNQLVANDASTVRLAWTHSPVDGTAQTDAKVQYRIGSGNWINIALTNKKNAYVDVSMGTFSVNSNVEWRVATKGAHPDFSDFATSKFKVVGKPQISFLGLPAARNVLHKLPLEVKWSYSDPSGTLTSLTLEVYQDDDLITKKTLPKNATSYTLEDIFFYDDVSYTMKLHAVSSTRFTDDDAKVFEMQYTDMIFTRGFSVAARFTESNGYSVVNIEKVLPDAGTSSTQTGNQIYSTARVKQFYLYRLYNGERTFIASQKVDLSAYNSITKFTYVDKTAPINRDFDYRLVQISEGDNETGISRNNIYNYETIWWYLYYGKNGIIKTRWNPNSSVSLGRPERQEIMYSGRNYPVIYDSVAREETFSYDFIILREDQYYGRYEDTGIEVIQKFKDMMRQGGTGFWKSFEGDVYKASFGFTYSSDYTEGVPMWNCSLDIKRIEGD